MEEYEKELEGWFLSLSGEERRVVDEWFYRLVGGSVCDDGSMIWGTAWIDAWELMMGKFGIPRTGFEMASAEDRLNASGWYELEPWANLMERYEDGVVWAKGQGYGGWYWNYIPCLLWMGKLLGYGVDVRGLFCVG